MSENLNWMPAIVDNEQVFLRVDGIYEFIDEACKKSTVPKREKEVLIKFKKAIKNFEQIIIKANNNKRPATKSFDA